MVWLTMEEGGGREGGREGGGREGEGRGKERRGGEWTQKLHKVSKTPLTSLSLAFSAPVLLINTGEPEEEATEGR